jgi:hypothetical protein
VITGTAEEIGLESFADSFERSTALGETDRLLSTGLVAHVICSRE